jgi:hypothetical protein
MNTLDLVIVELPLIGRTPLYGYFYTHPNNWTNWKYFVSYTITYMNINI